MQKQPVSTSPRIFISYRRDDTAGHAGHLYADLVARFGADGVFMDTETIQPGANFTERLRREIESSDVLIALIGKHWLGRRLREPEDYVRAEIQLALGHKLLVIPVLVQGAGMPSIAKLPESISELGHRNALELSDSRWRHDFARLVETIHGHKRADSVERKLVTVLFADVVSSSELGSTQDPEVVRAVMSRYFEIARAAAEVHGGKVQQVVGDAVVVVFGVPRVHDDDAERAVRAALTIRDAAAKEAGVVGRVGINTGDAVATTGSEREFSVSGDTVNTAARLQQGADPGEVAVGALTEQLTRLAVEYAPRAPIVVKGTPEPIAAFTAVRPRRAVPEQVRGLIGVEAPMVGRQRELRLLLEAFGRVTDDKLAYVVTIVGTAGVGKSRLISEALHQMPGAQVLRGRCLPYGTAITWWCFAEMLRAAAGIGFTDDRDVALGKLDEHLSLLAAEDVRRAVRARLLVVLDLAAPESVLSEGAPERLAAELAWGLRRYFDAAALTAPVVAVIDDFQWADAPVVEAVGQLTDQAMNLPMLLICIARPEFVERNPAWGAGKVNAASMTIEPLSPAQTSTLISELLPVNDFPDDLKTRIIERSEGMPLYCEELLSMLIANGKLVPDGPRWKATGKVEEIEVPRTIQALLSARLDSLEPDEKGALQAASVVGERFRTVEIHALVDRPVTSTLERLRRKGLLIEDREAVGGDGWRFRHLLIRDAAYDSTTKSDRASLHEQFGNLVAQSAGDPGQFMDILFYQAERAMSLSSEVMLQGPDMERRAQRAFELATNIGYAAFAALNWKKLVFATSVADRATSHLVGTGGAEARAEVALLVSVDKSLTDLRGSIPALVEAERLAADCGRLDLIAKAKLRRAWIEHNTHAKEEDLGLVREAIDACVRAGDKGGEINARTLLVSMHLGTGRLRQVIDDGIDVKNQAVAIGAPARAAVVSSLMVIAAVLSGRGSYAEALAAEAESFCQSCGLVFTMAWVKFALAELAAYRGNPRDVVDAATALVAVAEDIGGATNIVDARRALGDAQIMCGEMGEGRVALEDALRLSELSGERWNRTEICASLALMALSTQDLENANRWVEQAMASSRHSDVHANSYAHRVLGLVQAASGRDAEAEASLRISIAIAGATDYRTLWAENVAALASFHHERGRREEAVAAANEIESWTKISGYTWLDDSLAAIRTGS